ncbi:MAG: hypothetical protein Q7T12_04070 [Flavobacterium sp.]|nr:hypothetical protein [Flavobacterium sp.]
MRYILICLAICVLLSCSNKKVEKFENTIGSSIIENEVATDTTLNAEAYAAEALIIMNKHKENLKTLLPQIILSEVEIYKKTLDQIEKKSAKTYTLDETNLAIALEQNKSGEKILEKEVELNQTYFQLFNELTLLNEKYKSKLTKEEFTDFYDAGPIVLAEEVMLKIDELVKDEKIRIVAENRKQNIDRALTFVSIIPGATVCKSVLGGLTQAAKVHLAKSVLPTSATQLSKIPLKLMNNSVANFIAKTFKNDQIRSKTSKIIGNSSTIINKGASGARYVSTWLPPDQAGEMFKVLENKINGRIGDFSDGILAVHMDRVRDIIKDNSAKLSENSVN